MRHGKGEDIVDDINAGIQRWMQFYTLLWPALSCISLFNPHHSSWLGASLTLPVLQKKCKCPGKTLAEGHAPCQWVPCPPRSLGSPVALTPVPSVSLSSSASLSLALGCLSFFILPSIFSLKVFFSSFLGFCDCYAEKLKKKAQFGAGDMAQLVTCFQCKHQELSLSPF